MTSKELAKLIEDNLENTQAFVESHDNVHFDAIVVSTAFDKVVNRVKRQQMVYATLGDKIQTGEVHALQLKTYTPDAWAKLNA